MSGHLLEMRSVSVGYGRTPVVRDLDLSVRQGEVVALLGPNGAGKTTTLLAVSGLARQLGGTIEVLGGSVPSLRRAHRLARRGVAHVPESRGVFRQLTVRENLLVAGGRRHRSLEPALELFPALAPLLGRRAALLSGGERQMLALGGAMLAEPRLLMVDELSLGLAPQIYAQLVPIMRRIARDTGAGVLMVEQHADLALAHSDRAYVLVHGDVVQEGRSQDLRQNRELLRDSYLGETP